MSILPGEAESRREVLFTLGQPAPDKKSSDNGRSPAVVSVRCNAMGRCIWCVNGPVCSHPIFILYVHGVLLWMCVLNVHNYVLFS